jgi:S-(hydroxymethyl)glutathione dehydrogenase / alcohol dehydrogenase
MNINAAILVEARRGFVVESVELGEPRKGEVLVKVAASGVCHSDWHLASGATKHPMPVVAGHEGAGVVTAVGAGVRNITVGDHVILNWAPACGGCFYCQRGKPNLCEAYVGPIWAGTMLDGTTRLRWKGSPVYHWCGLASFAEYTVVPQESCVVIRRDAPLTVAALVGCAVATGVGAVMHTAGVRSGESVAVFGCGGVGLSAIQGALLCEAGPIIAIDRSPGKLELAKRFGATHDVMAGTNAVADVRQLTGGRGADHVFEAVGLPAVQEEALGAARPGGTLTLAGLSAMGSGTNLPGAVITRQEKVIKGSYYGSVNPARDFPLILDLYMTGKLKLDQMITRRWQLGQINEAFAEMLTGEVARGVIVF